MKIHLIRKETIESYAKKHARSKRSLEDWIEKLKHADWEQPNMLKRLLILPIYWGAEVTGWYLILQETTSE